MAIVARRKIESFEKISPFRKSELLGSQGPQGERGESGPVGEQGLRGERGPQGLTGASGPKGDTGSKPGHKWEGTKLSFEKPDGTWGEEVDLQGKAGEKGGFVGQGLGNASIKYTKIDSTPYVINKNRLVTGHNIFGVDAGANATVYLPKETDPTKLIVINNESPTFTLTIKVFEPYVEDGYVEADYVEITQ
jgi:hypothetical protein